ncbi:MAG: hypothetical protein HY520_02595 [Candidatus Aenigmarchaeota archaeon]|nr:hypothetical protein [Candidatus Aenigmarchaeota archaeon]
MDRDQTEAIPPHRPALEGAVVPETEGQEGLEALRAPESAVPLPHGLGGTDWAVKRIKDGKRICFTFHVDDAARMVFAAKAYEHANQLHTADAL